MIETRAEEIDSDCWCTNRELARLVGHFSTDPCSNPRSHIDSDDRFMLERGDDGLIKPWGWSVWCNPPYSDPLPWAKRLAKHEGPWCALLKLDPTTKWWARLVDSGGTYALFRNRVKFERPDKPPLTANFPSALVFRDWSPSRELAELLWKPVTP